MGLAARDHALELGTDILGGAVSGGVMGGVAGGINAVMNAKNNANVSQNENTATPGDVSGLVADAVEQGKAGEAQGRNTQAAFTPQEVADMLANGGQLPENTENNTAPLQQNIDNTADTRYNSYHNGGGVNVTNGSTQNFGNGMGGRQGPLEQVDRRGNVIDRSAGLSGVVRVSPELQNAYNSRGIVNLEMYDTSGSNAAFSSALEAARNADVKNGWAVTPKSTEDLNGVKTYMTADNNAGFGIARDGDIEAIFKNKEAGARGALNTLIPTALENGGTKLDCYGEKLVDLYARYGFAPVARVEFNEAYANPGWDSSKGRPYVYFMMHNGDSAADVINKKGTYKVWSCAELEALPLFNKESYDAAYAYRDSLMNNHSGNKGGGNTAYDGLGAADKGFSAPTQGRQVETQNKTVTESPYMTDAEKARLNPGTHKEVTGEMSLERARQKWIKTGDGLITKTSDILSDPRISRGNTNSPTARLTRALTESWRNT